jgi:hypothetical protein
VPLSALQIIQAAADELGLPRPAIGFSDPSDQTRQLMALANRVGSDMVSARDWTRLIADHTITITPPISTTGTITAGSDVVTAIPSTSGLTAAEWAASGNGLMQNTRVREVISATSIRLSAPATVSGSGVALQFARDSYPAPADMDRYVSRTMWDRTNRWELIGPQSPQEDQWMRNGIVSVGPRIRWMQAGRARLFRLYPAPFGVAQTQAVSFQYMSNAWATSAAGAPKSAFTADDDTSVFADDIMVIGVKWRFLREKQLEWRDVRRDWDEIVATEIAHDGDSPTLSMTRRRAPLFVTPANIQDGNFPGAA